MKNNSYKRDEQLKPTKIHLSMQGQLCKILEEVIEAISAFQDLRERVEKNEKSGFENARWHFLEELCDVQVAIETLKCKNFSRKQLIKIHKLVNKKNKQRGYL